MTSLKFQDEEMLDEANKSLRGTRTASYIDPTTKAPAPISYAFGGDNTTFSYRTGPDFD